MVLVERTGELLQVFEKLGMIARREASIPLSLRVYDIRRVHNTRPCWSSGRGQAQIWGRTTILLTAVLWENPLIDDVISDLNTTSTDPYPQARFRVVSAPRSGDWLFAPYQLLQAET